MATCANCGTTGPPTPTGACMACGHQVTPPPAPEPPPPPVAAVPPPYQPAAALPPPPAGVAPAGQRVHCTQCGHTLGGTDRFCANCSAPRSNATTAPGAAAAPRPTVEPSAGAADEAQERRNRMIAAGAIAGLLIVVVAVIGLQTRSSDDGSDSVAADEDTATTSLTSRTQQLASQLTARLCPGEYCVDGSSPGVITIDSRPGGEYGNILVDFTSLEDVAQDLGVWSVADAQRMGQTRALDGTQSSANGAVTWTYHPDSGIDIVIDVESLPTAG